MWNAIYIMCELFSKVAKDVGSHFGYTYEIADEKNMTEYLKGIRDKYDSKFL
jgi:aminoglycoside 6-adenylyltransferase